MQRGKTATGGYRNIGGEVGESVDLVGEVEYWLLEQKERERERFGGILNIFQNFPNNTQIILLVFQTNFSIRFFEKQ